MLLWYTTVGAFIGMFGVVTYHPVLKLPMPWWFRSALVGAWMNFVLAFFAYDEMARMMIAVFGEGGCWLRRSGSPSRVQSSGWLSVILPPASVVKARRRWAGSRWLAIAQAEYVFMVDKRHADSELPSGP
jgi:hypothetical protein